MRYYILRIKINGIKNLDKEITLDFYNKTIKKKFELNDSNIKAIYGANGSGKSGIMNAFDIYKRLITESNYLSDNHTKKYLNEIINKKLKKFSVQVVFAIYDETKDNHIRNIMSHQIILSKKSGQDFYIEWESLEELSGQTLDTAKKKVLVCCKDGIIVSSDFKEIENIKPLTINLLKSQSIITILLDDYVENTDKDNIHNFNTSTKLLYLSILISGFLGSKLKVCLSYEDEHLESMVKKDVNMDMHLYSNIIKGLEDINKKYWNIIYVDDLVPKKHLDIYLNQISKMETFIKIFKPDLIEIEVEHREVEDFIVCSKYFVYKDFKIYSEYESTGIKKLITLYSAFCRLDAGEIVFIDEFDANLHDVYLCKLLEYFSLYSKGQLCFTTHNLAPMTILGKRKHGLDFLSDDSRITSWKRQGNYSAMNLYKSGMIENSPFNIEAFDFLGLFEGDID